MTYEKREIIALREAIRRYLDHSRTGTVEPMSVQQAIDRAFENPEADDITDGISARITALEAENAKLWEALQPYADVYDAVRILFEAKERATTLNKETEGNTQ